LLGVELHYFRRAMAAQGAHLCVGQASIRSRSIPAMPEAHEFHIRVDMVEHWEEFTSAAEM